MNDFFTLNTWAKQFSFFRENAHLNLLLNTKSSFSLYLLDLKYYEEIIINSRIFFDYFTSCRQNTNKLVVVPSVCNHYHPCTPQTNYLGIRYDLYDENGDIFYKIKFSPFFSKECQRVEFNLGIVFKNPLDISSMKKYNCFMSYFKLVKHTCLSPSHLYIYKLTNSFFSEGLDTTHPLYRRDIEVLNTYADEVNNRISDAGAIFDERGIFSYNKTHKLKTIIERVLDIPFYNTSSYIISH
jgi:hypothetical protein